MKYWKQNRMAIGLLETFAVQRFITDGNKNFHNVLPRNQVISLKDMFYKLVIDKNRKKHTVNVNRDILDLLVRLSLSSRQAVDC